MKNILYQIIIVVFLCQGCGTLVALSDNKQWPNQIYAGTRASYQGFHTQLDVPFSCIMDTVVLPYTIPRTIYNYSKIKKEQTTKEKSNNGAETRNNDK